MIAPEVLAAAKAVDIEALVGRYVKLQRRPGNRGLWGCCPFHPDKTPSLKAENARGTFKCFGCNVGGDAVAFLQLIEHLPFPKAVEELAGGRAAPIAPRLVPTVASAGPDPRALGLWAERRPVMGSVVEAYLTARGIDPNGRHSLGFISHARHPTGIRLPAMVAAVQGPDGDVIAAQLTFLDHRGRKTSLGLARQTFGALRGGAVRFGHADHRLGLAEGAETAMSAQALFGIPTWSTLGAARLDRIAIPASVKEIVLFGDNDEPGHAAVVRAATTYGAKYQVRTEFPAVSFGDWNDAARHRPEQPA